MPQIVSTLSLVVYIQELLQARVWEASWNENNNSIKHCQCVLLHFTWNYERWESWEHSINGKQYNERKWLFRRQSRCKVSTEFVSGMCHPLIIRKRFYSVRFFFCFFPNAKCHHALSSYYRDTAIKETALALTYLQMHKCIWYPCEYVCSLLLTHCLNGYKLF